MKKLYHIVAMSAIFLGMFITYQNSKDSKQLSSLTIANIEALARGEMSTGYQRKWTETSEKENVEVLEEGHLYKITTWTQKSTMCEGIGSIECIPDVEVSNVESHIIEVLNNNL